jgi:hypothetical protein
MLLLAACALSVQAQSIMIETKMSPPLWALLERQLLDANSRACDRFADQYLDARGYLLHTPRWGTLDGPDDAIETFYNWTLLHAMGGSNSVLRNFKRALDGHYLQYKELRTVKTELAKDGAYHHEFITQSDWFHTGEGMRGIMLQALSDPHDDKLISRMQRFAALYMGEPNYDPQRKLIKSIWTGSNGPMLHKATAYDWVGDPATGTFHLLHSPGGRHQMYDIEKQYPKMLAHCAEYLDSVGDHPLNMASTGLAVNAFVLTGDEKYRRWIADYIGAWKDRTAQTGGNIPTNVGLDGSPGGEYGGKWYKGTYGWNFTIFDGEIEQIAHRNTVFAGSWPGFANLFLTSGDASVLATMRKQMDNLYAQKKVVDGKTTLPQMYGDPRGHKSTGQEQWYHFTPNLHIDQLIDIYMLSMDRRDLERVPKTGWIGYLEGGEPDFPEKALRRDLEFVRKQVAEMRNDPTSADTRLADYVQGNNPAITDALSKLTLGAHLSGNIWSLHARFRYFDPQKRRAGLPDAVAALVTKLGPDSASVTLVNTDNVELRTVVVQAGGYAEHEFTAVSVDGKEKPLAARALTVKLAPGSGATLEFRMRRYAHAPAASMPWDR